LLFSRETLKLDPGTDRVKLQIEITTAEGTRMNLLKYLRRFADEKVSRSPGSSSTLANEKLENANFKTAIHSMGWKLFEFWDSSILSNTHIKITRAIKIKSQSQLLNTETKVLDSIWNDPEYDKHFQNNDFDFASVAKAYGNRTSESEEIVEFLVKVTIGENYWFVSHRYREFDGLRKFILSQNPFNTEFQSIDAKFPGKILNIGYRKGAMDKRVDGLETFLTFYLDNARFCRQNSIDALCSFLQVCSVVDLGFSCFLFSPFISLSPLLFPCIDCTFEYISLFISNPFFLFGSSTVLFFVYFFGLLIQFVSITKNR
jgi:hypothetical protein